MTTPSRFVLHALTLTLSAALLPLSAQAQSATPPTTSPASANPASSSSATTQLTTQQQGAQAAAEARDLAARARSAYPPGSASIDQDLWKQAAAAAERAVQAAPTNPDYLRLRAQIYTEVGFWRQAELSWSAYFRAAPGAAGRTDVQQAANVQYNLGYAAYTRNQPSPAAAFFARCLELDDQNALCTAWAARTALEAGNYTQAQGLYERALRLTPNDKTLVYFRNLAQSAGRYGPAATRAFSRAYGDLVAGQKTQALAGFQAAASAAPNFMEAWREAGRLALELGDARAAVSAYQGATALPGASAADRYNLALAEEGAQYGLNAVRAFRNAYAKYVAGDKTNAEIGFLDATNLSPTYAKAWTWLGRTRYEAKNYAAAAQAYGQAVALNPDDQTSAYFLRLAQQGK